MFRIGKALNLIHIHLASEQEQMYPSRSSERGREGENRPKTGGRGLTQIPTLWNIRAKSRKTASIGWPGR